MKELPPLSGKYSYADLQEAIAHVSDRDKLPLYKCKHPLAVQLIADWLDRYFEEEPNKEPFFAFATHEGWCIQYASEDDIIVTIPYEYDARIACESLNMYWNRREQ